MLVLVILDDGVGIKPSQLKSNRSFGLLGMKERSSFIQADLKITVSEGGGTRLELTVPLEGGEDVENTDS
ncbi:MAG: hypothetical protein K9K78_06100, partial [Spirochaetales bacterium]|nr:hypothetical protein [Spirochaetales bacterium]